MSESATLLPQDRRRELRKVESELLSLEDGSADRCSSWWGVADSAGFLLGYVLLSVGANVYMVATTPGNVGLFYAANALFSLVGLAGLVMMQPALLLVYGGYLCASFLFSSVISGGTMLFLMQSDVCKAIGEILPGADIKEFCLAGPVRFQVIAVATVFGELALEMFVMWQAKRMYDHARTSESSSQRGGDKWAECEKPPKGKLGSIAILQP